MGSKCLVDLEHPCLCRGSVDGTDDENKYQSGRLNWRKAKRRVDEIRADVARRRMSIEMETSGCLASGGRNGFPLSLAWSSRRRVTAEAFQSLVGWADKYSFGIELMAYPDVHRKEAPYDIRKQNKRVIFSYIFVQQK